MSKKSALASNKVNKKCAVVTNKVSKRSAAAAKKVSEEKPSGVDTVSDKRHQKRIDVFAKTLTKPNQTHKLTMYRVQHAMTMLRLALRALKKSGKGTMRHTKRGEQGVKKAAEWF